MNGLASCCWNQLLCYPLQVPLYFEVFPNFLKNLIILLDVDWDFLCSMYSWSYIISPGVGVTATNDTETKCPWIAVHGLGLLPSLIIPTWKLFTPHQWVTWRLHNCYCILYRVSRNIGSTSFFCHFLTFWSTYRGTSDLFSTATRILKIDLEIAEIIEVKVATPNTEIIFYLNSKMSISKWRVPTLTSYI